MRQVWITKHGPPEVLAVHDAPTPSPGAGEVPIAAAGIDFADIMARRGVYPDAPMSISRTITDDEPIACQRSPHDASGRIAA